MQCRGGANVCKMATSASASASADGVLLGGVEWSSSPVTFHRNTGKNVELTESSTVATRVRDHDYGVVFTSEPMVVGQMFKVTVTEKKEGWYAGMVRDDLVCVGRSTAYSCYIINKQMGSKVKVASNT